MSITSSAIINGLPLIILGSLVYILIRMKYLEKKKRKPVFGRELLIFFFVLYILIVLGVTIVPRWAFNVLTSEGRKLMSVSHNRGFAHTNLVPFKTIRSYYYVDAAGARHFRSTGFINIMGNVGLFIPFGILGILVYYGKRHARRRLLLLGIILCFTIETVQSFIGRSSDVDDVILNIVGLLIGLVIGNIGVLIKNGSFKIQKTTRESHEPSPEDKGNPESVEYRRKANPRQMENQVRCEENMTTESGKESMIKPSLQKKSGSKHSMSRMKSKEEIVAVEKRIRNEKDYNIISGSHTDSDSL